VLAETQELMEQHGDVYWEPELVRLSGRLGAAENGPAEGATAFKRALALARERRAHLLALRAATDLARLRSEDGHRTEARQVLASVHASFSGGFEAKDVKEAKAVLDDLETSG
jgi:hypothetical protein